MAYINTRKLREMHEKMGARQCVAHLTEALEKKQLRPEEFSLRELFEGLVVDRQSGDVIGPQVVKEFSPRSGGIDLLEAGHAVDTSAFSNISGQIVYSKIMEAYEAPVFLWPQLCTTIPTQLNGEKIPGIGELGDAAEVVAEGRPYPTVGLAEDWVETPSTTKRGMIVPVTKEAIFFDRTGILLKRAGDVGNWLGVNKEKRIVDLVVGTTNTYKWKGTAYNTYQTSTPWINTTVEVLTDYTDINAAELLFDAMTDPNTGEPILLGTERTLIVPSALRLTADHILSATQIWQVPNANAGTAYIQQIWQNPAAGMYTVLSGPMIYARTSSLVKWFYGNPKRAFAYMENWGIQTQQAPSNSEPEFTSDIVVRYKVSERGVAAVLEPRYMVYSTGAGA